MPNKYDLLPTVKVGLRPVTVGSMRVLNKFGMFEEKFINEVKELYLKPHELHEFILAVFDLNDEQKAELKKEAEDNNCDNINLEEMIRGYFDFFDKLQPNNNRLQELLKSSMDTILKTKAS